VGALAGGAVRSRFADLDASTHEVVHAGSGLRATVAAGIAVLSAGGTAALCAAASGSLGPARLAQTGPEPGPVARAVGIEVLIGAAIMLLSPASDRDRERTVERPAAPQAPADDVTAPLEPLPVAPLPVEPPTGADTWAPAGEMDADARTGPIVLPPVPAAQAEPEPEPEPVEPEPVEPEAPKPPPPTASRPDLGPNRPNPLPPAAAPGGRDGS
jgi:hypothetical protein